MLIVERRSLVLYPICIHLITSFMRHILFQILLQLHRVHRNYLYWNGFPLDLLINLRKVCYINCTTRMAGVYMGSAL